MSPSVLRLSGSSIVVLGSFNPSIFQPAWFAAHELITSGEADDANIAVVHKEISSFSTEYWNFQCTTDRLSVGSERAPTLEIIKDLILGIFTLLSHTPVQAIGINRAEHWEMESEASLHALGYRLVPRNHWTSILKNPALQTLTVQGDRPDDYEGYIRVKVEPSLRFANGVFMEINDHVELSGIEDVEGASKLVKLLSSEWQSSRDRAETIINGVVNG